MCHPNQEGDRTWLDGVKPIGGYDQRGSLERFLPKGFLFLVLLLFSLTLFSMCYLKYLCDL